MTNVPVPAQAPISWGEEVKPDSVWSWSHLGYSPVVSHAEFRFMIMSRDGSRRIIRAPVAGIPRGGNFLDRAVISTPDDYFQLWEGLKLHAEWLKDRSDQTVLLIASLAPGATVGFHNMPGTYLPYNTLNGQVLISPDPVNPIPGANKIRDAISSIAAGWDVVWHSRYIFSDHLRQQVTGRLIDGFLANIEREIKTLLINARPAENTYWKAKLAVVETVAETMCGMCTGDPYVWARALARNIDLHAFRLRLDQGEVPAVNMATKPWQPGTTITSATFPPNTDVNAKKELVARWHDSNQAIVENELLRWHDEVFLDPEPTYAPAGDHFHK